MIQDLRLAWRRLAARPGFAVGAVASIALGLGASTAVFSLVNGVLLRPLPFPKADRLSFLTREGEASVPDGVDWRRESGAFETIALFARQRALEWTDDTGATRRVAAALVEPEFFSVLQAAPLLGRPILADDGRAGGNPVAVLRETFWKTRFGADPGIVGRVIQLSNQSTQIVGVVPDAVDFLDDGVDLWLPLAVVLPQALDDRGANSFDAIGRLRPEATMAAARDEIERITTRLATEHPRTNARKILKPVGLLDFLTVEVRQPLLLLQGAIGLVVLLASVNLAGLLLARESGRTPELAVRRALGASAFHLARLVAAEGLLLGLLGGVLGVLIAYASMDVLRSLVPATLPRADGVVMDLRVVLFGVGSALLVAILAGLIPAVQMLRRDPSSALADAGRGAAGSARRHRLLVSLVVSEVALAFVLLVGAGQLLRTLDRLQRVPLGFRTDNVLVGWLALPQARYSTLPRQTAAMREIVERVSALPGVETAAFTMGGLLEQGAVGNVVLVEGRAAEPDGQARSARARPVLGDFFGALQVGVREGRALAPQDDERATRVAVVNERFAREFFPGESPLGRRIAWRDWLDWRANAPAWMTIVGVAADVKSTTLREADAPAVYTPYVQRTATWFRFGTLVVKASGEATPLSPSVRAAIREVDPALTLAGAMTLEERVGRALSEPRFLASGASAFGLVALGLALQGLFALLAFVVAESRSEIGVRMALGATSKDVLALVLRRGARLTAFGLTLGALAALAVEKVMAGVLFEVKPADPVTYAAVGLAFGLVALAAIALPARNAARTDPVEALRAG